ncbi:hypothetical protein G7K_3287-t1 [Saitoella complicata NRRL Y-17804]|uniref:SH3 domain-containing protein n=2 Tax=Saitoella complicata (strain BCRC 22490 / CBS 7301 / JCM 7358 / NBRC 10748 / NRRL Y-17804) TaxID=698492 RepID=A0A0E9NH10_SAICN|nr:hypothetical protein G7K_3287-t1 [Saitoella complicata NRRL Y-17804]
MSIVPPKLPAWCRAVYSWSAESKGDLGFVEGDMIEVIGLGDGLWWHGRLKRNRTTGVFPSNFVELIPSKDDMEEDRQRSISRATMRERSASRISMHGRGPSPTPTMYTLRDEVEFHQPEETYDYPDYDVEPQQRRTPSPMAHAMQDVLDSLDDMSVTQDNGYDDEGYTASPALRSGTAMSTRSRHGEFGTRPMSYHGGLGEAGYERPSTRLSTRPMSYHEGLVASTPPLARTKSNATLRRAISPAPVATKDEEANDVPPPPPPHRTLSRAASRTDSHAASSAYGSTTRSVFSLAGSDFSATSAGSLIRRRMRQEVGQESFAVPAPLTRTKSWKGSLRRIASRRSVREKESQKEGSVQSAQAYDSGISVGGSDSRSASSASGRFTGMGSMERPVLRTKKSFIKGVQKVFSAVSLKSPGKGFGGSTAIGSPIMAGPTTSTGQMQAYEIVRRDLYRANSVSSNERRDRVQRLEIDGLPVLDSIAIVEEGMQGEEDADGNPIQEGTSQVRIDWASVGLVDKAVRYLQTLPLTTVGNVAVSHICRPYKNDIQRLRAIWTWVSEKMVLEEGALTDGEGDGASSQINARRVVERRRGTCEEVAWVVKVMCEAIGVPCQIVRGHLKQPADVPGDAVLGEVNHVWNAVLVEGEWRMFDVALANAGHPMHANLVSHAKERDHWFLGRPSQWIYTHLPVRADQQHIVPPLPVDVAMALPFTAPAYWMKNMEMVEYDTSLGRIEDLDIAQFDVRVGEDVDCVCEVETLAGAVLRKRSMAQCLWVDGRRTWRFKAVLKPGVGVGILKVYACKKNTVGMSSAQVSPPSLALCLPIVHTPGKFPTPDYEFLTRYPAPQVAAYDIYVRTPQCARLYAGNTYTFALKQFSSRASLAATLKPAKIGLLTPSGKIVRIRRNEENERGEWEVSVKINEPGVWRGLVMPGEGGGKWCVFAEWKCVA